MNLAIFLTGMMTGLSLIVAIGAQNAFVLRQGLRGHHVLAVCLTCALSDAALIVLGVTGFKRIATMLPLIEPVMRVAGAAFLIWYGARSLKAAISATDALDASGKAAPGGVWRTVLACLALTWLNPHVYLDTVVLLGTMSVRFAGDRDAFAAGAVTASILFFFALGYGATSLRPVFAQPTAWRVLEAINTVIMWSIAATLLMG